MKKRYLILIILLIIAAIFLLYYANDYSRADDTSLSYINGSENVSVTKINKGLFIDGPGNDTALIFYPGAKIEYTSYLPLMNELANRGVDAYLVEMPLNLALLDIDSADEIIKNSNYSHYVLAGHSLGGSMAAKYSSNHNVSGLVLLAAYTADEIDKPVLSIYGSNDKLLNMKTYDEAKSLVKGNFTEDIIEGGNHGQFANCGFLEKDGNATINSTVQQNETVNDIIDFINHYIKSGSIH